MLASLRIRNLALVEELLWEPGAGFTVISGETGAGKSVLIGALMMLLGERADKSLIRSGEDSCTVEAVFEGVHEARIASLLEEGGAEPCEDGRLLLKRSVAVAGAGRQFVNGSPCTLGLLRALGDLLVDLHGPHDHQSLFSRDQQTRLLDAFAGNEKIFRDFSEARGRALALRRESEALSGDGGAVLREIDLLEHQVSEIEEAGLSEGEEEALLARHQAAANAARITTLCGQLASRLSAEGSGVVDGIAEAVRTTREIARLDSNAEPLAGAAETAATALAELTSTLDAYASDFDADPATLASTETRLDLIGTLKRKYGQSISEVLAFGESAATRLRELRARAARASGLDKELAAAEEAMRAASLRLASTRQKSAGNLEKAVSVALADLGFAKCGFSVLLEPQAGPGPLGGELAEFLFAPNPGEEARPLRAIASSGEISRVMLALKGTLSALDQVPVLVFDEIDANVGGEIAARVGRRMRKLAEGRQVFCITHLPQVAALASEHFVVSKDTSGDRTRTALSRTEGNDRIEEIARMLGGKSGAARAHAKELLHSQEG
jgi:DNA repair protein RecN (Recombination protein N)